MGTSTTTLIPVEEYLNGSADPGMEMEYVDGLLVERNLDDWMHGLVQSNIIFELRRKYPELKVLAPIRTRVSERRYYMPDVVALLTLPPIREDVLYDAPFLVIEILSHGDNMERVMDKFVDYESKGVPNIWYIVPRRQKMYVFQSGDLIEVKGKVIATGEPRFELTRDEIFQT